MKKEKELAVKVKSIGLPIADGIHYRLVSDQMINLTKNKAFEILEYDTFSAERPVREYHVQRLYNEWMAGRFIWHQAMVAHGIIMERAEDGTMKPHVYRLNGQHTCWMRVNIPKEKDPAVCKVRQLIYEASDMDALRELYAVIDRNAPRTDAHISRVLMASASTAIGLPLSYLSRLIGGLRLWLWESPWDRRFKGTPQDVSELTQGKYADLFRIVSTYFQVRYSEWSPLRRAGIVAALFATFEKVGGKAPDFWDTVCSGLNLDSKTDPRYQLRKYCEEHTLNPKSGNETINSEDQYRTAINMWNKWRKNEPVLVIRATDNRIKPI